MALRSCVAAISLAALGFGAATTDDLSAAASLAADECSAAPGEDSDCALSALQRRGLRARQGTRARTSVLERAPAHLAGWSRQGRSPGDEVHELGLVLRQQQLDELRALAQERTDPTSPLFRQWVTREEIKSEFGNREAAQKVVDILVRDHPEVEVLHVSDEGELVTIRAPISVMEEMLGSEFHDYRHDKHDGVKRRTTEYRLPEDLHPHVEAVLGAVDFDAPAPMPRNDGPQSPELDGLSRHHLGYDSVEELRAAKNGFITTPQTLQKYYNVPKPALRKTELAERQAATRQVVYATLGQFWSPSDRAQFQRSLQIPDDNYVTQVAGHLEGNAKSGDAQCRENPNICVESNLDVQYMMAMAPWAETGYWYVREATAQGMASFLIDFLARFIHSDSAPHVISMSYGMPEIGVTKGTSALFEAMMMKLAARGVTVVVASGDDGAASSLAKTPWSGEECRAVKRFGLQPMWPASSAWVTAVGGTMGAEMGKPEVACSSNESRYWDEGGAIAQITTGGGYSNQHARPDWQTGVHEMSGRGLPDISVAGHAYAIVLGGSWLTVDGTSASAPVVAGMVSLINAQLIAQGKPTVGFLNPVLYRAAASGGDVFRDITEGDNRCGSFGAPCCGGYDAAPGWDPVTGLGVPQFNALEAALISASP